MADPQFRAAGTVASATSGSISPGLPSGWQAGDIHVLFVITGATPTLGCSGFTQKLTVDNGTGHRFEMWWRRAVGGDTAPSVTGATQDVRAVICGFFDCIDSGDPFADAQIQQNGSSATATAPAVSNTAAGQAVIFATGWTTTGAETPTCSGYSGTDPTFGEDVDSTGFGSTVNTALAVAHGAKSSVGSTGSRTATWTDANLNSALMAVLIGSGFILPTAGAQLDIEREAEWQPQRWDFPLGADLLLDDFLPSTPPSGTVVNVPLGTLTLAAFAPTVVNPKSVSVPLGTLTLTGFAPAVQTPRTIAVPLATLTINGISPAVAATANVLISVPLGTLTLAGFAPTVTASGGVTISVPVATLSLAAFAPVVSVTTNVLVLIPLATLTLAAFAPTVVVSGAAAANDGFHIIERRRRQRRT